MVPVRVKRPSAGNPRYGTSRFEVAGRKRVFRGKPVLAGALDKDITVEGEMISSEALKNALSKPSCISISSTAKPILSLDRSSRGLFANKFRQASGTNPLDMSGPRHIPHGYFRWDASAMNAHSSERRSPLTRRWSGMDSNLQFRAG